MSISIRPSSGETIFASPLEPIVIHLMSQESASPTLWTNLPFLELSSHSQSSGTADAAVASAVYAAASARARECFRVSETPWRAVEPPGARSFDASVIVIPLVCGACARARARELTFCAKSRAAPQHV